MKTIVLAAAMLIASATYAQRIKITEGDLSVLASESTISTEFTYDNMQVGKYDKEADYVAHKKGEMNAKEAGRGDRWERDWVADRKNQFEPKFNDLFEKGSKMTVKSGAKYTLIFKTVTTEPGFNIVIHRKNAEINADVWIVETANPKKVLAKLTVQKAVGRTFGGGDYDTGGRLAEAYADAGKALGKFVKDKASK